MEKLKKIIPKINTMSGKTKEDIINELELEFDKIEDFVGEWCHEQVAHRAMDEYAKQEAIEFFKWNAMKAAEYIDYLRRVDKAEGISEKELELDSFENSTIAKRYELYRKERENNLLASEIH